MVVERDLVALAYEDRLTALLEQQVGLWDTIASAQRAGSLDSAIREARHNDLQDLCASLPNLQAVAFNGAKSAQTGKKLLDPCKTQLIALPSSSPAYAALPRHEKERQWLKLRKFIG